jgi:hypothetical protein
MSRRKMLDFVRSTRMPRTRAQSSLRHRGALSHSNCSHRSRTRLGRGGRSVGGGEFAGCSASQCHASLVDTEMGFLRKPPKGLMTPASGLLRAVGLMFGDRHRFNAVRILWRSLSRRWLAIGRLLSEIGRSSARVWADPFLPVILLGVVATAFGFAFILNAPPEIVFGVLAIGGVTAYLETKQRN